MSDCANCNGIGLVVTEKNGSRVARRCECMIEKILAQQLDKAKLPIRYRAITFDGYRTEGLNATCIQAKRKAQALVANYIPGQPMRGLLLTGTVGVGKTHIAIATLRELVSTRGVTGLFCDFRELLTSIKESYGDSSKGSEAQILKPVFDCDVVVLDELGAMKLTDWVFDTAELIINTRYNAGRTTIITTNYSASLAAPADGANKYARAATQETLRDRVGARMYSRLLEMCETVEMHGDDYRAKKGNKIV